MVFCSNVAFKGWVVGWAFNSFSLRVNKLLLHHILREAVALWLAC